MSLPIEGYALISDCHTGALVGNDGSIDWLCFPRYDSDAMFAALLGDERNGRWLLAPADSEATSTREYLGNSFVLRTVWRTPTGSVEVTDLMPMHDRRADVIRRVRGIGGEVEFRQEIELRFGYGAIVPWIRRIADDEDGEPRHRHQQTLHAVAGPDAVIVRGTRLPEANDHKHEGTFTVAAGETYDFTLTWFPAHRPPPGPIDVDRRIEHTLDYWREWAANCDHKGAYGDAVIRSLGVLRALTNEDTGGIVAAATTSLPEQPGGPRNWDYRYCWLRDAALTLESLLAHGFRDAASHWRNWLLRAVAGDPDDVQIMYGLSGERRLPERTLDHLPGYEDSAPVRVGNAAVDQYQADVWGEVMCALEQARVAGVREDAFSWPLQRSLLNYLEKHWQDPDNGIWEVRGERRHFTHSRVMVWAAFDRGVRAVEEYGLEGEADRWRELRQTLREEIEAQGYNRELGRFVQYYGGTELDASLLQLPQVGFLAYDDERMLRTVRAMEEELLQDGLLLRYDTTANDVDGLPPGEHPFLACSFWLVEQYAKAGEPERATRLMDHLVTLGNDLGLFAEEYDTGGRRLLGNFPQAFSHLALVRAADAISTAHPLT